MRIVVFGATGGTGRQIVEQALGHGHEVTAFVHSQALGIDASGLREIRGDALDFDDVAAAIEGADAVASALGARRGAPRGFLTTSVAQIIHGMAVHDVRKLAVVSAAGAFDRSAPGLPLAYRALVSTVLKSSYDDIEDMERRIRASDLTWTVLRPGGLTDGPFTGTYRFTLDGSVPPKSRTISRADVAAAVLKALETSLWDRRAVTVVD